MSNGPRDYHKSPLVNALLGSPPRQTYFEALGTFMHEFAETESLLHVLLRFRAGVSEEIAKALFTGVRADAAMDLIRRIAEINPENRALDSDLTGTFKQFKILTQARNDIVHFGASLKDDYEGRVTNASRVLAQSQIRNTPVSPEILAAMASDALKVRVHIMAAMDVPTVRVALAEVLSDAWQYKPAQVRPLPSNKSGQSGRNRRRAPKTPH
jgi:hypothetical protein